MAEVLTPPKKTPVQKFVMPSIERGEVAICLSAPDDTEGYLVMVTQVNENSINVVRMGTYMQSLDAIRHRDDPVLKENPFLLQETGGCWTESSQQVRMREIEKTLARQAQEMGELRAMLQRRGKGE